MSKTKTTKQQKAIIAKVLAGCATEIWHYQVIDQTISRLLDALGVSGSFFPEETDLTEARDYFETMVVSEIFEALGGDYNVKGADHDALYALASDAFYDKAYEEKS